MGVSPTSLFIIIAVLFPFIVQTRTVAGLLGIEQTVGQTVLIGVIVVGAVLIWAAEVPLPGRD